MLKRLGISLRIGVSRQALTLVRLSRWRGEAVTVLADQALTEHDIGSPERLGVALRQLLAGSACARLPVSIVLADDLVRLWQVTPPQGATRLADIEAAAALRFQTLYGEASLQWAIAADWDAREPFLAAAMPRAMLDAFNQLARDEHFTIVGISSQLISAWNHWRGNIVSGAWFALVHDGQLTLGVCSGKRLGAVRSMPMPGACDIEWLREQVAREALRLNLAAPSEVQACGQVPAAWTDADAGAGFSCTRLDQARRGMATPSAGVMLAQTGVLA